MPEPIEPEIVEEGEPLDREARARGEKERARVMARLEVLIQTIKENTRTNQHLTRLLESQQSTGLSRPTAKTAFDRVVDHALEAFPPDTLRDMMEGFLHDLAPQRSKKRRRR